MATYKHLRSSTANKRPTTSIADGQLALNTNATSPGLFFKDSTGATIIKIGPVHVGTTAPNATPGAGGSSGNSTGEVWLDTSITPVGVKIWNGSAWVNGTPTGSTTVQGLLELATDVETQSGSDAARAVTPAGLQSKVSDSISTTSSTTIASSTAVKAAYDLAAAGLPRSGGTITGNLEIGTTGSLTFEGSVADGFETALAVTNPTANRVITLPDISGTVVTTGDTGSVTSAMIANGTIVSGDIASSTIVDSNISASAEIAVSKLADGAAGQIIQSDSAGTGVEWSDTANLPLGSAAAPAYRFQGDTNTGIYSPGADQVAISTNGTGRLFVDSNGKVGIGTATAADDAVLTVTKGTNIAYPGQNNAQLHINNSTGAAGVLIASSTLSNIFFADAAASNIGRIYYDHSSDFLAIHTNSSERMRLDSIGRLGLGTSSPGTILDVRGIVSIGSANNSNAIIQKSAVPIGSFNLTITSGGGLTSESATTPTDALAGSVIKLLGGDPTTDTFGGGIQYYANGSTSPNGAGVGNQHVFYTRSAANTYTERLRIDSAGRVGIGTTSPAYPVHLASAVSGGGDIGYRVQDTTNNKIVQLHRTGSTYSYIGIGATEGVVYSDTTLSLAADNSNPIKFCAGGGEAARIDSSKRLLVGTSTAKTNYFGSGSIGSNFQVVGSTHAESSIIVHNQAAGTQAPYFQLGKARGTGFEIVSNADLLGSFAYFGADGSSMRPAASIDAYVDGTPGANDMPGRLVFSTTADGASSPTERMRINSAGNVGINATSNSSYRLLLQTASAIESALATQGFSGDTATQSILVVKFDNDTTTSQNFIQFQVNNGGANCGKITANGANTAAFASTSDVRVKENIVDLPSQIENIKSLRPVEFDYNEDYGGGRQIGFIAQEMQGVFPDVVSGDGTEENILSITGWSKTEARLVKALQEAITKIETLEAKVAALEAS